MRKAAPSRRYGRADKKVDRNKGVGMTLSCKDHTQEPEGLGFIQFDAWARHMSKTHNQTKCPECGLWKIWIPKKEKAK